MRISFLSLAIFGIAPLSAAQNFDYPDFSNMTGLVLNQDAAQFNGNTLRLTPSVASAKGSCYYSTPVTVNGGFQAIFDFKVDTQTCSGADGIAFIIHNDSRTTSFLGLGGGQIGYGGAVGSGNGAYNALVIELDSYLNGADLSANEVSVHTNGPADLDSDEAFSIGSATAPVNMWDEQVHTCMISYIPGTLTVHIDGSQVVSTTYDFATGGTFIGGGTVGGIPLINGTDAYVGFTAACGGCTENHDVLSWSWGPYIPPPPPPVVIWEEDFDGGTFPPAGWTVIDNVGNGDQWETSSFWTHGNLSGGQGECAAADSDNIGSGFLFDSELITPAFDVTSTTQFLGYSHYYNSFGGDQGDVDVSVGGGAWTNLVSYTTTTGPGRAAVDLGAYSGSNIRIRFHYNDNNVWAWYWHVDDVGLYQPVGAGPGTPYCPGDGVIPHTLCPCANNNDGSMGGCDWGDLAFPEGGVLTATGTDSMALNNTLLVATGVADNFGIFFGADNQVNSGNGNPLNDGLRCAGGGLVRLIPPTMASGNQMTLPAPLQSLDTGAASGTTRRYQYWFRTPNGPCGQMANLTNGYEIVWMP